MGALAGDEAAAVPAGQTHATIGLQSAGRGGIVAIPKGRILILGKLL